MDIFSVINGGNDDGSHEIYQWNEPVCCVLCLPLKPIIKYFGVIFFNLSCFHIVKDQMLFLFAKT